MWFKCTGPFENEHCSDLQNRAIIGTGFVQIIKANKLRIAKTLIKFLELTSKMYF